MLYSRVKVKPLGSLAFPLFSCCFPFHARNRRVSLSAKVMKGPRSRIGKKRKKRNHPQEKKKRIGPCMVGLGPGCCLGSWVLHLFPHLPGA